MARKTMLDIKVLLLTALLTFGTIGFAQSEADLKSPKDQPLVTPEMITLPSTSNTESYKLTIKGPNNYLFETEFAGENIPFIEAYGVNGELLPDGIYSFRLESRKFYSDDALDALRFARTTGDMSEVEEMRKAGTMPAENEPQYGYFTIHNGSIVVPEVEGQIAAKNEGRDSGDKPGEPIGDDDVVIGDVGVIDSDGGVRDQVILDDLIVDGSACIGFDCVNGESFGFDTIRLKENNLRIKFDDTSSAGSFPDNDWQLTANASANGGAEKFSIDDISNSRTPFTVEARAPSHSLYVDDGGRIGVRTSTPVADIHVVDGDSPTLRLEQNGSSGFAPQSWDLAGNETNFFVRDVSNGSQLPLRIRPSAPTSSIFIDTDGDVGLGTASPDTALDVDGSTGDAVVLAQSSAGLPSFQAKYTGTNASRREMFFLSNYGEPAFRFSNTDPSAADDWSMILLASDQFLISRNGSGANEFTLDPGGDLTIGGGITELSDVHSKENFEEIDPLEVLDRVVDLPISKWNYIKDEDSVRHMGPTAQDFAAAFGLGKSNTGITNVDANGVMLAAIQGLNQRINEKEADLDHKDLTIAELQKENANLTQRIEELENGSQKDLEQRVAELEKLLRSLTEKTKHINCRD